MGAPASRNTIGRQKPIPLAGKISQVSMSETTWKRTKPAGRGRNLGSGGTLKERTIEDGSFTGSIGSEGVSDDLMRMSCQRAQGVRDHSN